jgi:pimeloyl-ACP methyl ester carboxylesterase
MTREERARHPGDEDLFVPANGFNLGSTVTKPVGATGRLPAVVLVPGHGPEDRDYVSYGIPVLGELAGSLAAAGFLSVRYDSRGIGQSGGRTESATMTEYADDIHAVIEWLRKRRDVDGERIAVVGYGEAGPLALLAASRIKRIKGVALLAAPGRGGRDITMQQQQKLLDELSVPSAEKNARRSMQARVLDATVTGKGWEGIPADLRRQTDTPWFRSWLLFQPAEAITKMQQPMLILHGERDTEFPPAHADELEALARARKKLAPTATQKVIVAGTNHLLVPAETGAISEYSSLTSRTLAPEVGRALTDWLKAILPPR